MRVSVSGRKIDAVSSQTYRQANPAGFGGLCRRCGTRTSGSSLILFRSDDRLGDAVRFEEPWPRARFREGRHFMDDKIGFLSSLVEGSTTVFPDYGGLRWAVLGETGVVSAFR